MLVFALTICGGATFGASAALACIVCLPYPETTHADKLLASDAVALAREDSSQPFSLAAVEILKGAVRGELTDMFLPSAIRRQLMSKPGDRIVLVEALANIRREGTVLDRPSALAVDTHLNMAARFTKLAPLE